MKRLHSLHHIIRQSIAEAGSVQLVHGEYHKRDLLLPGSLVTLAGLVLTVVGATLLNHWAGIGLILLGRSLDLLDGPIARATHTVTALTVILDPIADKLALVAIVLGLIYYQLAPWQAIIYVAGANLVVAALSTIAERKGNARGALIPGKLAMFFQSTALILFALAPLLPSQTQIIHTLAISSILLSMPCVGLAIIRYGQQALQR
jgi:cardiolipin synthase (CMP-forming)